MTILTVLLFVIALELMAAVTALLWVMVRGKDAFSRTQKSGESEETAEAKRKDELEKAWNEGVNSILSFDMKTAGEAMKRYGEKDRE